MFVVRSKEFWLSSDTFFPAIHQNHNFSDTFRYVLFNSITNSTSFCQPLSINLTVSQIQRGGVSGTRPIGYLDIDYLNIDYSNIDYLNIDYSNIDYVNID